MIFCHESGISAMIFMSDKLKIIAESPHFWQKIVIHSNPYIILYVLACI